MLLENVRVIMVGTRFPENIGMAARACANMGCPTIRLVRPELWIKDKAVPLATAKGLAVLETIQIYDSLSSAVADSHLVIGTTARTGGWRKGILSVVSAAEHIKLGVRNDEYVSLVFGPEDRGLDNTEISLCHELLTIPTENGASSLNVAQAILLVLHECAMAVRKSSDSVATSRQESRIAARDMERLMGSLREALLSLDCLHGDNPSYFFLPWQRLLHKAHLTRQEYDALMGLCRQIRYKLDAASSH